MTGAVVALTALLAAANGANDVSKGVATLAGAGITRYRHAIAWGTGATLAGSLFSVAVADRLTTLFSSGIVTARPSDAFAVAVLAGASAWVVAATVARLPVSTTQAIVGALVGAGLVLNSDAVAWGVLPARIVIPSVLAIGVAYGISFALSVVPSSTRDCLCVTVGEAISPVAATDGMLAFHASPPHSPVRLEVGTTAECRVHGTGRRALRVTRNGAHWLSSGAASFARGVNDTAKIVAVGAFTLVPAGVSATEVLVLVAAAMAVGSMVGGMRVARRLGDDIVALSHVEGFRANLTTAVLVGLSANQGVPLSTTQVSASAIAGASGTNPRRLHAKTLSEFVIAWTVTPLFSALVAGVVYAMLR